MAIYFAAIAAALTNHRQRITRLSDSELLKAFDYYTQRPWVTPEFQLLFPKAVKCLGENET